MIQIPVDNRNPAFDLTVDLEGSTYLMSFRWDNRIAIWKYDLKNSAGEPIYSGISLFSAVIPPVNSVSSEAPPGYFAPINLKSPNVDADRFTLGTDVRLYYVESTDVETI